MAAQRVQHSAPRLPSTTIVISARIRCASACGFTRRCKRRSSPSRSSRFMRFLHRAARDLHFAAREATGMRASWRSNASKFAVGVVDVPILISTMNILLEV